MHFFSIQNLLFCDYSFRSLYIEECSSAAVQSAGNNLTKEGHIIGPFMENQNCLLSTINYDCPKIGDSIWNVDQLLCIMQCK